MTQPRRIPPTRTTFAVCRRVHDRRFLLRPDGALTGLFVFLLASVAVRLGVEVHAVCVMSTHYHMVVTVDQQRISKLCELFHGPLARAVNVLRRARRGVLWEPGRLSILVLETRAAVIDQIAYTIANPVASGLVWRPEDWPGLCTRVEDLGRRVFEAALPTGGFLRADGAWDETARLAITLPSTHGLGDEDPDAVRAEIARALEHKIAQAHAEIRRRRVPVLGPIGARHVAPYRRAKSWEEFGTRNPHFATGPGCVPERVAAASRLVTFRVEYREAWRRFQAGEEDVVFPYGTYLMRVRFGFRVAEPP